MRRHIIFPKEEYYVNGCLLLILDCGTCNINFHDKNKKIFFRHYFFRPARHHSPVCGEFYRRICRYEHKHKSAYACVMRRRRYSGGNLFAVVGNNFQIITVDFLYKL